MDFGIFLIYVASYFGLFTAIFFFVTLFENKNEKIHKLPRDLPKVSIIIPAFNEEETIGKTIESLLDLDYPRQKLEIIVVNDGSKDNTLKVAKHYIPKGIVVLSKKNGGKGKALNFGIKKATGIFVGCLDADSYVAKDSLKKIIPYFYDKNIMAVTPALKVSKPKNVYQRIQMVEYLMGVFLRKTFSYLNSIHVTPGPFTIYRKEFFDNYGGYSEHNLTEDIEVALRIQKHGYVIENSHEANVYTNAPTTFNTLYRQRIRWYTGFIDNVYDYRGLFSKKYGNLGLFVLPLAFISIFLVIISMIYFSYKLVSNFLQNYLNMQSIHFDFLRLFQFDLNNFYINISAAVILSILTFILGIILLVIAKRMASEATRISFSYGLYLMFYWFLFGFWWFMALFYKAIRKKVAW
jgi:cellulose synthase/poly-beta-1,6-N-acetylglucosamine synthase-like glycosyltransferase